MFVIATAVLAAGISTQTPEEATAQIDVTYNGFTAQAEAAFEEAAAIWERCLVSPVPIEIVVTSIANGPYGFAYQNVVRNEPYLPIKNAWYPTALAGALSGTDVSQEPDIAIYLRADALEHMGALEDLPEGQTDFINIAVHEIAHGIGISSATYIPFEGVPMASIGRPNAFVDYFDFPFEVHEQDGTPFVYDMLVKLADGRSILDFPNPSIELAFALANPTVHFIGAQATAANGGYPVGVSPTNIGHIPQFPRAPQPIMLPDGGRGAPERNPDKILLGMLQDIGWTISDACQARAK